MAEAVEELRVRPIMRSRYRTSSERALANVELFLEMARAYDVRGLTAFVEALRTNWDDSEKKTEGRPDADAEAVSIITMHSAKGLEWPIVIPINSATALSNDMEFLHRRADDTVHFKLLGNSHVQYEQVKRGEQDQLRRERIRVWYVALTRASDLLLLPRRSERAESDWFSLVSPQLDELPAFDGSSSSSRSPSPMEEVENLQDESTWRAEAAAIAATRRMIVWRSPSRHDAIAGDRLGAAEEDVVTEMIMAGERLPGDLGAALPGRAIQGGRERGLVLHKLLEEVLTGEVSEDLLELEARARRLLAELDTPEADRPEDGPHAPELASSTVRALAMPVVAALRARLLPEMTVYACERAGRETTYVGGVADAIAVNADGTVDVVIDWKSDTSPDETAINLYRQQVVDYLDATGAREGLLVFVTTGNVVRVSR
jgi:exodeoxyribonuclease-5